MEMRDIIHIHEEMNKRSVFVVVVILALPHIHADRANLMYVICTNDAVYGGPRVLYNIGNISKSIGKKIVKKSVLFELHHRTFNDIHMTRIFILKLEFNKELIGNNLDYRKRVAALLYQWLGFDCACRRLILYLKKIAWNFLVWRFSKQKALQTENLIRYRKQLNLSNWFTLGQQLASILRNKH